MIGYLESILGGSGAASDVPSNETSTTSKDETSAVSSNETSNEKVTGGANEPSADPSTSSSNDASTVSSNDSSPKLTGGKTTVTFICLIMGTIESNLKAHLEKKHLLYVDLGEAIPGIVSDAYASFDNRYYTKTQIISQVTANVANYIESKAKEETVFIVSLARPLFSLLDLIRILSEKMTCRTYFLNLNVEGLFKTFFDANTKTQNYNPPQTLLDRVAIYYDKVPAKTDNSIFFTRRSLKEYLLTKKYFFRSEQDLDEVVKEFFSYYSEGGEELHLQFAMNSSDKITVINATMTDNLDKYFNEIKTN